MRSYMITYINIIVFTTYMIAYIKIIVFTTYMRYLVIEANIEHVLCI